MARSTRGAVPPVGQEQQEEMTVVVLRLKGGGDTLKKGFDALTAAFNSLGPAPQVVKHVNGGTPRQLNGAVVPNTEDEETEEVADEATVIEATPPTPASTPRTPAQRKPKFLTDFDLNSGDKSWRDFATSKNPKTENEKYLLAALWITEKANVTDFTVSHVFTCFRAMKWPEQVDFSQPMRQMKSKDSYFSHPSRKTWKLTQPGLDAARAVKDAGAA
jgi:hypothetical protein